MSKQEKGKRVVQVEVTSVSNTVQQEDKWHVQAECAGNGIADIIDLAFNSQEQAEALQVGTQLQLII